MTKFCDLYFGNNQNFHLANQLVFLDIFLLQDYTKGELLTGFLKKELIDVITPICTVHQEKRKAITDDIVLEFMKPRPLNFKLTGAENK